MDEDRSSQIEIVRQTDVNFKEKVRYINRDTVLEIINRDFKEVIDDEFNKDIIEKANTLLYQLENWHITNEEFKKEYVELQLQLHTFIKNKTTVYYKSWDMLELDGDVEIKTF